jgi:hypothetical protein
MSGSTGGVMLRLIDGTLPFVGKKASLILLAR